MNSFMCKLAKFCETSFIFLASCKESSFLESRKECFSQDVLCEESFASLA